VETGELLGTIESPELDHEIARTSLELRVLESRRLRLDADAGTREESAQEAQEGRDLAGRVEVVAQSLARLHAVRSQLAVYAPCAGQVQKELPATTVVAPRQLLVSLYPDGGELLAEVSGPVEVITRLQRADVVAATFTTAGGDVELFARPVAGSVHHFRKSLGGGHEETWATVQCQPEFVPPALQTTGLIGELR
jgi:multidrug efflux pump subunit AcrA (membrane-fusion protein)